MKNIIICILCALSLLLYVRGSINESEFNYYIEYIEIQDNLLQVVYDNDPDFFNDVLMKTDEYYRLDSIMNNPY